MTTKHSLVRQHFHTARYFAARSEELEQGRKSAADDESDDSIDKIWPTHRSYVMGAIVAAVAGLESYINELYLDACDNNLTGLLGDVGDTDIAVLALKWQEIERKPILCKFQLALRLTCGEGFDKGRRPFQDVACLVRLRNALVHYRPEWDSDLEVHADLQKTLGIKFPMNPLADRTSLWFPHQCLGSGCAM